MLSFVRDSGLVYAETSVSGKKHKCKGQTAISHRGSNPAGSLSCRGTRSLHGMAVRRVLCNLDRINANSIARLPEMLLSQIWRAIKKSNLDSLHVWKLFMHTELANTSWERDWRTGCSECSVLPPAIDAATSVSGKWMTNLYLSQDHVVTPMDLTHISKLVNLRNLSIERPGSAYAYATAEMNDSILRTWANEAETNGAFKYLEMIFLAGQVNITRWSLRYLNAFPELHTFCLRSRGALADTCEVPHGWFLNQDPVFLTLAAVVSCGSWLDCVVRYIRRTRDARSNPIVDETPVLSVYVGQDDGGRVGWNLHRDIAWLQRIQPIDEIPAIPSASQTADSKTTPGSLASKRRKLKNGKAVPLRDLLAGM